MRHRAVDQDDSRLPSPLASTVQAHTGHGGHVQHQHCTARSDRPHQRQVINVWIGMISSRIGAAVDVDGCYPCWSILQVVEGAGYTLIRTHCLVGWSPTQRSSSDRSTAIQPSVSPASPSCESGVSELTRDAGGGRTRTLTPLSETPSPSSLTHWPCSAAARVSACPSFHVL